MKGSPVQAAVGYAANEWMFFQLHVKIGTWYRNDGRYHSDSTVQLWVTREGRPSRLVVDLSPEPVSFFGVSIPGTGNGYDLANENPAAKYGKVWLLPYPTGKSPQQNHPIGYTGTTKGAEPQSRGGNHGMGDRHPASGFSAHEPVPRSCPPPHKRA